MQRCLHHQPHLHGADFDDGVDVEMLVISNALVLLEGEVVLVQVDDVLQSTAAIRQFPAASGQIFHHCLVLLGNLPLHTTIMNSESPS